MTRFLVTLLRGTTRHSDVIEASDADEARVLAAEKKGDTPGDRWEMTPVPVLTPQQRADLRGIQARGYIRPPECLDKAAVHQWGNRMDHTVVPAGLATHDGHGGYNITELGAAALQGGA